MASYRDNFSCFPPPPPPPPPPFFSVSSARLQPHFMLMEFLEYPFVWIEGFVLLQLRFSYIGLRIVDTSLCLDWESCTYIGGLLWPIQRDLQFVLTRNQWYWKDFNSNGFKNRNVFLSWPVTSLITYIFIYLSCNYEIRVTFFYQLINPQFLIMFTLNYFVTNRIIRGRLGLTNTITWQHKMIPRAKL